MDLDAAGPLSLKWGADNSVASLNELHAYVVGETQKSIDWYWKNKRWPATIAQAIQFLTVALAGLAGVLPVLGQLAGLKTFQNGMWSALFVGTSGGLYSLDKAFGYSSGWARYVTAATSLRGALEDFRMTWIAMLAQVGPSPKPNEVSEAIAMARRFHLAVQTLVSQETQAWSAEFQSTKEGQGRAFSSQLEKMGLGAQLPPEAWGRAAGTAAQAGSIELAVPNASKADNGEVQIRLDGVDGKIAEETLRGSATWVRLNVAPGQYRITVSAKAATKPVEAIAAVIVKAGEIAKLSVSLPL
jgi:hypothetical protein